MNSELSVEQAVEAYKATVYGIALTHTSSRADADDVFQEVFLAYWRSKPDITGEEHRKAWLIRTTLNFCLKNTQSSWARKVVYTDGVDHSEEVEPPPAEFPFQTEQQAALYEAIGGLPIVYRTAVQLFYFEDLPIAQIAEMLDEEQGTVRTRLSRARAQLRVKLQKGV